jgi:hypothetical protein
MREGKIFSSTEDNIDIDIYKLSKREDKQQKKYKYINETNKNL